MVYDCFNFFNELDLLEIRMNILNEIVDFFVIAESRTTFAGEQKSLYFLDNRERFLQFENKIIHVLIDDTKGENSFERDSYEKNAVCRGIVNCNENDIIIYGDIDEIPDPLKLTKIIKNFNINTYYHLAQFNYYFYFNYKETTGNLLSSKGDFQNSLKKSGNWLGTTVCSGLLVEKNHYKLENLRLPSCLKQGVRVEEGGWHFSFMGGSSLGTQERIQNKIEAYAHQEYNNPKILESAIFKLEHGLDIFDRKAFFSYVPLDDGYPKYIRENMEKYSHLILQEDEICNELICHMYRYKYLLVDKLQILVSFITRPSKRRNS